MRRASPRAARGQTGLKLKSIEQFELQPGPVVARWSLCLSVRVATINDDDLSATRRAARALSCLASVLLAR